MASVKPPGLTLLSKAVGPLVRWVLCPGMGHCVVYRRHSISPHGLEQCWAPGTCRAGLISQGQPCSLPVFAAFAAPCNWVFLTTADQ